MAIEPHAEREMYLPVSRWLRAFLTQRNKRSKVRAFDTSAVSLWTWIEKNGFQGYFAEYLAYDIHVDVTGVVYTRKSAHLAFVECKVKPITLKDVSQLLGYCRVARPSLAWILSPAGMSTRLSYLLKTYRRYDVLCYDGERRIRIATWNHTRKDIDLSSVLPPG